MQAPGDGTIGTGGSGSTSESPTGGMARRASGGGGPSPAFGDTTQDAMAKVLHERYLSEREKAKTLAARLKESEVRMGDLEEVSWVVGCFGDRSVSGGRSVFVCRSVDVDRMFGVLMFRGDRARVIHLIIQ